ncbi:hypothetical protein P7C73_g652, partial [Tremellales sp. Uapishka_1]
MNQTRRVLQIALLPSRTSTTEIGQVFEAHSLRYLNDHLHMSLANVGGAGDGGVDLRGWWWLPKSTKRRVKDGEMDLKKLRRIRVTGQCKAERLRLGPKYVREMEGVMSHQRGQSPVRKKEDPNMAVLVSQSGFSTAAMVHASKSTTPLLLVHLPGGQPSDDEDLDKDMVVDGAWWNLALSMDVLGGAMELKREMVLESEEVKARVGLWHLGHRFQGVGPAVDVIT